jgi:integrase
LTAAFTGIRRGELEQLVWGDFHLDVAEPFVNVRASISKNHKQAGLPLSVEVVAALRQHRQPETLPGDFGFLTSFHALNCFGKI